MTEILKWQGFPADLADLVRRLYQGASYSLKTAPGKRSSSTKQKSGIRQGSSLSPLIFVLILGFALHAFEEAMHELGHWARSKVDAAFVSWLGFVDDLVIRSNTREEAQQALIQLQAACRFVGLELNAKKTEAMTIGLPPTKKDNEDAKKERVVVNEGDTDERKGWAIEWDGVDLAPEFAAAAKRKQSQSMPMEKITHLIAWDDGKFSLCWLKKTSWAHLDGREVARVTRMGRVRHVLESKNVHRCPRCNDVLPDAKALKFHMATGYCRPEMSVQEQRVLRVGRYLEERAKTQREAVVVPAGLQTHDGKPVKTVGVFRYLGTQVQNNGTTSKETERRTGIARATVQQLRNVWADKTTPTGLKAELFASLCSSVALYNSECWAPRESDWRTLRKFQLQALRTVLCEKRQWQREQQQQAGGGPGKRRRRRRRLRWQDGALPAARRS